MTQRQRRTLAVAAVGIAAAAAAAALVSSSSLGLAAAAAQEQEECSADDGTCHNVDIMEQQEVDEMEDEEEEEEEEERQLIEEEEEEVFIQAPGCTLYLAESTLPGAGLGIFSSVEKQVGDVIGTGDVCIPYYDMYWHNDADFFPNPFRDYFWMGTSMGMTFETDSDDNEAYCPGLDCAVNCNPALINVDKMTPQYDTAGLHRLVDPGVGAYTPYHNGTTFVSRRIPAGGELFKDYGEHWFEYRQHIFGDIPFSYNYDEASELLNKMNQIMANDDNDNDSASADLYETIRSFRTAGYSSRTLNALPETYNVAKQALAGGGGGDLSQLRQPDATRDLDWLDQHGRCIDHILPMRSTLPQAGHGAMAARDLPKGSTITTSPLHHVPDKRFANLYNFTTTEQGEWVRIQDQVVGHQLMLNYCYGHSWSTLIVCPYGAGVNYINHANSTLANVKIRWAIDFPLGHNATAVSEGPLEYLESVEKPKLAFDYVATRDIRAGEELFLDYGDEWQQAWDQHVASYKPHSTDRYEHGRFWNQHFANAMLRTVNEQQFDPYPDNIQIRCHAGLSNNQGETYWEWSLRDTGLPCRILHREYRPSKSEGGNEQGAYFYSVELEHHYDEKVTRTVRPNVPRQSIRFFDVPMTTDIHLPNAFRHVIGIPDAIFPEQWKNLADIEEEDLFFQRLMRDNDDYVPPDSEYYAEDDDEDYGDDDDDQYEPDDDDEMWEEEE